MSPVLSGQVWQKSKPAEKTLPGTTRTVGFDENPDVTDRLIRALAYHRNRDYADAFRYYMKVLQLPKPTLFRLNNNLLANSRDFCLDRIRALPTQFIKTHRLSIDGQARREFTEAMRPVTAKQSKDGSFDVKVLEELSRRHFVSSVGDEILDTLAEVHREQGRPAQAALAWQRLLRWCPDTDMDVAIIRVKLASAAVDAGNLRLAEQTLTEFEKQHGERKLTIAGKTVDGSTYLRELVATSGVSRQVGTAKDPAGWLEFGGSPARDGLMGASFRNDAWIWSFGLPYFDGASSASGRTSRVPVGGRVIVHNARAVFNINNMMGRSRSASTTSLPNRPFMPVYDDGRLFLTDGGGVICMDVRTGTLCWATPGYKGRSVAYKRAFNTRTGRYVTQAPKQSYSCVVRDGVVYATLKTKNGGMILALEAQGGRTLWMFPSGGEPAPEILRSAIALSDPLIVGNKLYVGVHAAIQGEGSYYLLCIDLNSRHMLWKSFICRGMQSSRRGQGIARMMFGIRTLAYGNGLVYVNTALGGLAAVDADTGQMQWGYAYERELLPAYRGRGHQVQSAVPTINPGPVLVGNVLCTAPIDSGVLYGLNPQTGQTLWKLPRKGVQTILGGADETLYLSGKEMWWVDVQTGKVKKWANEPLDFAGQGFVTTDSLYVPTRKYIWQFDRKSGKLTERIGLDGSGDEAGNLLLVDGQFLSVTNSTVHVFGVWKEAQAELKTAIRANPANPVPCERRGQGYARRQEWLSAIGDYHLALTRFEKRNGPGDHAAVKRIKRELCTLYDNESKQTLGAGKFNEGLKLARQMQHFAYNGQIRMKATMRIIDSQRRLQKWTDVVAGFRELIEHCPDVMYRFDGSTNLAAGLFAELEIAKLIKKHGRTCYDKFDRQAAQLVAVGKREDYRKVLSKYRNSTYVGRALLGLSRISAASGDYCRAARLMEGFVDRGCGNNDVERANALWLTANYLERADMLAQARRRYSQLATNYPQAMVTVDGTKLAVTNVVKTKLALPAFVGLKHKQKRLPRLGVPLSERWTVSVPNGVLISDESSRARSGLTTKTFFRTSSGEIICLDPTSGKQVWKKKLGGQIRQAVLHGERLLAYMHNKVLVMLDTKDGKELWRRTHDKFIQHMAMDKSDVVVAGADQIRRGRRGQGAAVEIVLMRARDGAVRWRMKPGMSQTSWIKLHGDRVAVVSSQPAGMTLLGREAGRQLVALSEPKGTYLAGLPVMLNDDHLLVSLRVNRKPGVVNCYDLRKGVKLWSATHGQTNYQMPLARENLSPSGNLAVLTSTRQGVTCVDTRTGQILWKKNVSLGRRYVTKIGVDEKDCYVVSFEQTRLTRVTTVTKLALADGKHLWSVQLPKNYQGREILVAADMVVLPVLRWQRRANRFTVGDVQVCFLDKHIGKLVQTLKSQQQGGGLSKAFATGDGQLCVLFRQAIIGYASTE